ncbi:hypothetical protein LOTGIDRAFT_230876 [Lottia gigantea]|uniref:Uncharacterized protein n=1 Tax=Lottia gigantea TaxID=225164 RepID=V4B131_LOTGI|nr:hypothetical protein LOTGIDRAFT_230876 [Lottia gigantea]ESO99946.1 hypothetical protein LOTGIDRAFT_230876 [Lottia gigantea]
MDVILPPSFLKTFNSIGITRQSDNWKIEERDRKITVTLTWDVDQENEARHPKTDKNHEKGSKKQNVSEGTKASKESTNTNNATNGYNTLSWSRSQTSTDSSSLITDTEPAKENLSTRSGSRSACEDDNRFKNKPSGLEIVPDNCVRMMDKEVSHRTIKGEIKIKMESTEIEALLKKTGEYDSISSVSNPDNLQNSHQRAHSISESGGTVSLKQVPNHNSVDREQTTKNTKISTYPSKLCNGTLTPNEITSVKIEPSQTEPEDNRQNELTTDQIQRESSGTDIRDVWQKPAVNFAHSTCTHLCDMPVDEFKSCDNTNRVSSNDFQQPHSMENTVKHPNVFRDSNNNQQLTAHSQSVGEQGRNKRKSLPERPPFLKSLNRVLTEKEIDIRVDKFAKKLRKQRKWIPDRYNHDNSYEINEIDGFKRRIRAVNQWQIVRRRFEQSMSKVEGQSSLEIAPEVPSSWSDSDSDREPYLKGSSKKKHEVDPNRPPFLKSINRILNADELEDKIQQFSKKVYNERRWIFAHFQRYAKNEVDGFKCRIMSVSYWHIEQKRLSDTGKASDKCLKSFPQTSTESCQNSTSSDSSNGSISERGKSKKSGKRRKKELQNQKPAKFQKIAE